MLDGLSQGAMRSAFKEDQAGLAGGMRVAVAGFTGSWRRTHCFSPWQNLAGAKRQSR